MAPRERDVIAKEKAKKLAENRKKRLKEIEEGKRNSIKGPPTREISEQEVEDLAKDDLTAIEIAACLNVDFQTLYNRKDLFDAMKRGREKGNASLRRKLHQMVHDDNHANVAIFLGKSRLGYNDGGNLGVAETKPFKEKKI